MAMKRKLYIYQYGSEFNPTRFSRLDISISPSREKAKNPMITEKISSRPFQWGSIHKARRAFSKFQH